jgi:mannitol-1-phosphate 5-dehydrogenase
MKKVLHFGAGNIGRGFFGQIYYEAGWEIIFADLAESLIQTLNTNQSYPLWIVGDHDEHLTIERCSGISLKERESIIQKALSADLISTAVGANNLKKLVPLLKDIIIKKASEDSSSTINIVIGENLLHSSFLLHGWLQETLPEKFHPYLLSQVGLVETVLSRMVPVVPEDVRAKEPLLVMVEPYKTLPVAKKSFRGGLPEIPGFSFVENLKPYEEMKLFIHNLSHAGFAYFGKRCNRLYLWESVKDNDTRRKVEDAFKEVREAISKKHRISIEELNAYYQDLLLRFQNQRLGDTVARVARDPIRKLGKNDRIIGAALLCQETKGAFNAVCEIAAAAIYYRDCSDPESLRLGRMLEENGLDWIFSEVCGIDSAGPIAETIRILTPLYSSFVKNI